MSTPRAVPVEDRIHSKYFVNAITDCWEWTAAKCNGGYGRIIADGRLQNAHRVMYELMVGPIPQGLHIDHLCRNHGCVNPEHLEPVTPRENVLRGTGLSAVHALKTHCVHGHPFDEANTYVDARGYRSCRACHRRRDAERKIRQRSADLDVAA